MLLIMFYLHVSCIFPILGCPGDSSKQNQCSTGECIVSDFVCDRFADCPNGEDESMSACGKFY